MWGVAAIVSEEHEFSVAILTQFHCKFWNPQSAFDCFRHDAFDKLNVRMAKDHYVPQFYLRNFSPAQSPNQIYRYRKTEGPQLVAINSVACEIGYYPRRIDK